MIETIITIKLIGITITVWLVNYILYKSICDLIIRHHKTSTTIETICDKYLNSTKLNKLDDISLVSDKEILDNYYKQSKNKELLKEKIQETLQIINKKLIRNYTN